MKKTKDKWPKGYAKLRKKTFIEEIPVLPVSNDYLEQVVGVQERNAGVQWGRPDKKP